MSTKILAVPKAAPDTAPAAKRPYLPHGTKHIFPCQADSIIDAAQYAREIGLLLNAHCTIMWNGTDAQTDTDGSRFTKVREGLRKALDRRGIPFTAVWAREERELHFGQHAHMVFHLPPELLAEIKRVIERLVYRHGGALWSDKTVDLKLHTNGDVRYLLKGGTPEVWRKYSVKRKWRRRQGVCLGKRCGTTQNIGPKERERWWAGLYRGIPAVSHEP